jgi:hypothetical protein
MASLSLEMPNSGYGDIADHNQLVSGLLATFMAGSLLGRWHLMSLVRHRAVGFFRSASSVILQRIGRAMREGSCL